MHYLLLAEKAKKKLTSNHEKNVLCLSPLKIPGCAIYKPLTKLYTRCLEHFLHPSSRSTISLTHLNPDYILTHVQTFYSSPLRDVKTPFLDYLEVVRSLLLPFIRVLCPIFRDVVSLLHHIREIAGPAFNLHPQSYESPTRHVKSLPYTTSRVYRFTGCFIPPPESN